jgi:hypothetical protein
MKQNHVGIILGIIFLIIGFGTSTARADDRNDAMCIAIYSMGIEHAETMKDKAIGNPDVAQGLNEGIRATRMGEIYTSYLSMFLWKHGRRGPIKQRADKYYDELESATVLLHLQRCEIRAYKIYEEYKLNK